MRALAEWDHPGRMVLRRPACRPGPDGNGSSIPIHPAPSWLKRRCRMHSAIFKMIIQHVGGILGDESSTAPGIFGDEIESTNRRRRRQPGRESATLAHKRELRVVLYLLAASLPLGDQIFDVSQAGKLEVRVGVPGQRGRWLGSHTVRDLRRTGFQFRSYTAQPIAGQTACRQNLRHLSSARRQTA